MRGTVRAISPRHVPGAVRGACGSVRVQRRPPRHRQRPRRRRRSPQSSRPSPTSRNSSRSPDSMKRGSRRSSTRSRWLLPAMASAWRRGSTTRCCRPSNTTGLSSRRSHRRLASARRGSPSWRRAMPWGRKPSVGSGTASSGRSSPARYRPTGMPDTEPAHARFKILGRQIKAAWRAAVSGRE